MDYMAWGAEYLEEAAKLKARSDQLQEQLKTERGEDAVRLYGRFSMIREMYLECLRTGRDLEERGKRFCGRQEKS